MTLDDYRRRLIAEIQSESTRLAVENGANYSRDLGELRFHAGRVLGLQQAIQIIDDYGKRDDEDHSA
jgi:hypothetical protein